MEAYLDNTATTKVALPVVDLMVQVMNKDYGNPSAMHLKGVEAEKYIKTAAKQIAKILKVDEKEILFTSGGTESNNFAIRGVAMAEKRRGKHIISTAIEHASVTETLHYLEEEGYEVTFLPVDKSGRISLADLENAIRKDTILVTVMYVNNEIGSVMPIQEIGEIIHRKNPNTVYHVDAIQAFGKYTIHPKKAGIDLLSVSGHKFHGPKGVGFLYKKDKVKLSPLIFGGGQQRGMRSGTENVPGIAGLGLACALAYEDLEKKVDELYELKEYFIEKVSAFEDVIINSPLGREGAPQIVSVSFKGIRSEVLLHSLEERGVYVSAGSACSTNKPAQSSTLKGIGAPAEVLESTVRISFCPETTKEELDYAIAQLEELLPMLRKYARR